MIFEFYITKLIADMNDLNPELNRGRRNWILAEKCIGIILIAWATFIFYSVVSTIADMYRSGYVASGKATFASIAAKNHLNIIICILCAIGGYMLLFKDKTGWILCVISSCMFGISLFISFRSHAINNASSFAKYYKSYGFASLLFFIILLLLLSNPIRKKYQPTLKTWLWIVSVLILMLIDKFIF